MTKAFNDNLAFLKKTERRLARRLPAARHEAEALVRHFGDLDRMELFTGEKSLDEQAKKAVGRAAALRLKGKPLSHILKEVEFCGVKLFVNKDVLTPRPETEILFEEAVRIAPTEIVDVGTGSGCLAISLTLALPKCRMTALDISLPALKVARKNLKMHGLEKKIALCRSDLFSALKGRKFDVIVTNPPYIKEEDLAKLPPEVCAEPRVALDGGRNGLEIIRKILHQAPSHLKKEGFLLMEIGQGQNAKLRDEIGQDRRYKNLRFVRDLTGIERVVVVQKRPTGPAASVSHGCSPDCFALRSKAAGVRAVGALLRVTRRPA